MKDGCSGKKDPSTITKHWFILSSHSTIVSFTSHLVIGCRPILSLMLLWGMLSWLGEIMSKTLHLLSCSSTSTLLLKQICGCSLIAMYLFCNQVCQNILGSPFWIIWTNFLSLNMNANYYLYLRLVWIHRRGRNSNLSLLLMHEINFF